MKSLFITLSVIALSAQLGGAADDEAKPKPAKPAGKQDINAKFDKLDTNGDGKISKEEFAASPMAKRLAEKADAHFAKLDADSDGFLSKEEFAAQAPARSALPKPEVGRPGGGLGREPAFAPDEAARPALPKPEVGRPGGGLGRQPVD